MYFKTVITAPSLVDSVNNETLCVGKGILQTKGEKASVRRESLLCGSFFPSAVKDKQGMRNLLLRFSMAVKKILTWSGLQGLQ